MQAVSELKQRALPYIDIFVGDDCLLKDCEKLSNQLKKVETKGKEKEKEDRDDNKEKDEELESEFLPLKTIVFDTIHNLCAIDNQLKDDEIQNVLQQLSDLHLIFDNDQTIRRKGCRCNG